jgi:hypothetical protein
LAFTTHLIWSSISYGIKWFQPPPDRSCWGSNRGPPYQVQRQSPLNQLTIGIPYSTLIMGKKKKLKHIAPLDLHINFEKPKQ